MCAVLRAGVWAVLRAGVWAVLRAGVWAVLRAGVCGRRGDCEGRWCPTGAAPTDVGWSGGGPGQRADLPRASAGSDMIGWGRVLLSHTLDAARSY